MHLLTNLIEKWFSSRAFSRDVMLSTNRAASIATTINIHLCKHLFTLLSATVSPWTSPFVVQAHDDRLRARCTWLPWISTAQTNGHVGGQHDVSENALFYGSLPLQYTQVNRNRPGELTRIYYSSLVQIYNHFPRLERGGGMIYWITSLGHRIILHIYAENSEYIWLILTFRIQHIWSRRWLSYPEFSGTVRCRPHGSRTLVEAEISVLRNMHKKNLE